MKKGETYTVVDVNMHRIVLEEDSMGEGTGNFAIIYAKANEGPTPDRPWAEIKVKTV